MSEQKKENKKKIAEQGTKNAHILNTELSFIDCTKNKGILR